MLLVTLVLGLWQTPLRCRGVERLCPRQQEKLATPDQNADCLGLRNFCQEGFNRSLESRDLLCSIHSVRRADSEAMIISLEGFCNV